jgi:cellulose synthase/poly-beta-1,6-N-acetylglucosamine synthase-like glycosyltransferase
MLSIIITAYKEETTIAKAIENIVNEKFSGLGRGNIDAQWELIVVAPDDATKSAARQEIESLGVPTNRFSILTDKCEGKPKALNMCFQQAKGDWLLLTDGDVYFGENAVTNLVKTAESDDKIGGVSGRPVSAQGKNTMFEYWGALLADAADHKRKIDLTEEAVGKSKLIVKKREFFPLSGYAMLVRNIGTNLPEDVLIDDAYISYVLHNEGYKLVYEPEAKVFVKYPTTISDFLKQKKRSTGGYVQLWKYGVVQDKTKSRSFWRELEYFWFPIKYAKNLEQMWWSLMLYPTRLWLWFKIYWERKIVKKDFTKTWVRVETTK